MGVKVGRDGRGSEGWDLFQAILGVGGMKPYEEAMAWAGERTQ